MANIQIAIDIQVLRGAKDIDDHRGVQVGGAANDSCDADDSHCNDHNIAGLCKDHTDAHESKSKRQGVAGLFRADLIVQPAPEIAQGNAHKSGNGHQVQNNVRRNADLKEVGEQQGHDAIAYQHHQAEGQHDQPCFLAANQPGKAPVMRSAGIGIDSRRVSIVRMIPHVLRKIRNQQE